MKSLIKIDSLKITFPRGLVQIVDNKLGEEYQRVYVHSGELEKRKNKDTGEMEDFVNLQKHVVDDTYGIKSRIALGSWVMGNNINEVVFIQVNAKMLRDRYSEGITKDNWKMVYDHIINQQVIYIDERAWLQGMVSDIDFCYDFEASQSELIQSNKMLYSMVLPQLQKFVDVPFSRQTNVGIQFNRREKATPAKPFAKIYHKGTELQFNSVEFYEKFLKDQDFSNVARLEVNLKNSKHKKHHNLIHIKSFEDLLNMKAKEKEKVLFDALPRYVTGITKENISKDLTPNDQYLVWLFNQLMRHGYGKSAFVAGLDIFEDKQQRHRMRKKLNKLFDEIHDQKTLTENTRIDEIFKQLRIIE
jgi:hypothetical protein